MIEAILSEAEAVADSRNDEVLDGLLWRLRLKEIEESNSNKAPCGHCWNKLKYVLNKIGAHRLRRRMEWAEGDRYVNCSRQREQALEAAFHFRRRYKATPCKCKGSTYRQIGKPFLTEAS